MSPLKAVLSAGDSLDDWISAVAGGLALSAPTAQLFGAADVVPEMSVTSAAVLVLLTLGRMHYSHARDVEAHRHQEALIAAEIKKILASKVPPDPTTFEDPDRAD